MSVYDRQQPLYQRVAVPHADKKKSRWIEEEENQRKKKIK